MVMAMQRMRKSKSTRVDACKSQSVFSFDSLDTDGVSFCSGTEEDDPSEEYEEILSCSACGEIGK